MGGGTELLALKHPGWSWTPGVHPGSPPYLHSPAPTSHWVPCRKEVAVSHVLVSRDLVTFWEWHLSGGLSGFKWLLESAPKPKATQYSRGMGNHRELLEHELRGGGGTHLSLSY